VSEGKDLVHEGQVQLIPFVDEAVGEGAGVSQRLDGEEVAECSEDWGGEHNRMPLSSSVMASEERSGDICSK